eukprot:786129-Rhodomonas_salina.1
MEIERQSERGEIDRDRDRAGREKEHLRALWAMRLAFSEAAASWAVSSAISASWAQPTKTRRQEKGNRKGRRCEVRV